MFRLILSGLFRYSRKGRVNRRPGRLSRDLEKSADRVDTIMSVYEAAQYKKEVGEEAANEAVGVFTAVMPSLNPGQALLADEYAIPETERYFNSTDSPSKDDYLTSVYSTHHAVEQALSDTCEKAFEAASQIHMARMTEYLDSSMKPWKRGRGRRMSNDREMSGRVSSWQGDFMNTYYDSGPGFFGRRTLNNKQFFGFDQPYWFTENRRMWMASIQGHMPQSEYRAKRDELFRATTRNSNSTSPPPGYKPYDGPEWEYRGR